MIEIKYCPPDYDPKGSSKNDNNGDNSGKGSKPEIVLPPPTNATNEIPDEVPRRDGPGGE
nr:hypothetical protein [uncultured Mediterraneibacter sp.]